jgi:hypothetical protein
MSSFKQIIDKLPSGQKDQIMYAFNHNETCHVEYEPGKYIGVNVSGNNFKVQEKFGSWSHGLILKGR